ncbi:MAG: hypothetical protein HY300_08525 [Verrucomicrobia bacterium]|nr:hypothetical protein [Verrucomicrobiota bacterium]
MTLQAVFPALGFPAQLRYLFVMTQTEQDILRALDALGAAVRSMKTASPKPSLLPLITRLDELAAQLGPDTDAELKHFLQRKSYEKARLHLQGRTAERGSCGH